jgi:hypothetical protein
VLEVEVEVVLLSRPRDTPDGQEDSLERRWPAALAIANILELDQVSYARSLLRSPAHRYWWYNSSLLLLPVRLLTRFVTITHKLMSSSVMIAPKDEVSMIISFNGPYF